MTRSELVVAVGDEHERPERREPPAEKAEQVERRFVRPVRVFDDDERWGQPRAELGQRGVKDLSS